MGDGSVGAVGGGLPTGERAAIFHERIGACVAPADESVGPGRGELGGVPLGAVGEEGFWDLESAENPVEHGQGKEPGNTLVGVDGGVVAQVEAVDVTPKAAEVFVLEKRGPALEGPMFEGVEDFVERQGEGEGGEAGEEPEICGTDTLAFDDFDAAMKAYNSPEWRAAREHTQASGARALRTWVREQVTII